MSATPNPLDDLDSVTPALPAYTDGVMMNDLWERTDLSPRDRSLDTMTSLVTGGHTAQLPFYLDQALDDVVTPSQIAEVVPHLAFYAGRARCPSPGSPRRSSPTMASMPAHCRRLVSR